MGYEEVVERMTRDVYTKFGNDLYYFINIYFMLFNKVLECDPFATAAVTYDIRKVGERYHRLPPPQVCQSAVDLIHDVFKIVTCTPHLFSHQGSACVCLVNPNKTKNKKTTLTAPLAATVVKPMLTTKLAAI